MMMMSMMSMMMMSMMMMSMRRRMMIMIIMRLIPIHISLFLSTGKDLPATDANGLCDPYIETTINGTYYDDDRDDEYDNYEYDDYNDDISASSLSSSSSSSFSFSIIYIGIKHSTRTVHKNRFPTYYTTQV
jgi:hypothetical protein